jgi:hypothetical protein
VRACTTIATFVKGAAAIGICLIGILGLICAWVLFIFSADAAPGDEGAIKVRAVLIGILTLGAVATGLYLMFRNPGDAKSDSTDEGGHRDQIECGACGRTFPSHYYARDPGPWGYICDDCAKNPRDA